jgi:hypothetical protein
VADASQPKRTEPADVLPYLLTRLISVTGLPAERCFVSQADEQPYDAQADQYLWLRVEDGGEDQGIRDGAGRLDARETVTLTVTARTRLALDEPGRDLSWMTHASLGHLRLAHAVKKALDGWQPTDGESNVLTTCPIRLLTPRKPRKDRKQPEWGESVQVYEMEILLNLDDINGLPAASL